MEIVPHQPKICLFPPPGKIPPPNFYCLISFPPKANYLSHLISYNPIKMSFFAVVIATVPFLF